LATKIAKVCCDRQYTAVLAYSANFIKFNFVIVMS